MPNKRFEFFFLISISILTLLSFFLGFVFDENSAGGGPNDSEHIWTNLQVFLTNDIRAAITHDDYFDGRSPVAYILHKYLNPFASDYLLYRKSVFALSLLLPLLLIITLKKKFFLEKKELLIFLGSIIFISPYFRTTSYWGIQENYGLFFLISSFLSILIYKEIEERNKKRFLFISFICLFSSLSFYFDQKLLIIPILSLLFILYNSSIYEKIFSITCFTIFSIPYLYFIYLWGGIIPTRQLERSLTFDLENIGYTITIIAFYVFPFFIIKKDCYSLIKNNFFKKKYFLLFVASLIYVLLFFINYEITSKHIYGGGVLYKIATLFFNDLYFQKIFLSFSILISSLIIIFYFTKSHDRLIFLYFILLSLIITPIYQEYYDPLIFIMLLTFFKESIEFTFKNVIFIFCYFLIFLTASNFYYILNPFEL